MERSLTKTLAREWGRMKVNVNCVAFGFIETRLTQPTTEEKTVSVEGREVKVGVRGDDHTRVVVRWLRHIRRFWILHVERRASQMAGVERRSERCASSPTCGAQRGKRDTDQRDGATRNVERRRELEVHRELVDIPARARKTTT